MRLPISPSLWLWSCFAPFLRYGVLLAKNCLLFLPLSRSVPPLSMFPLEFRGEVNRDETRVIGISSNEDRMILAGIILTWYRIVTHSQADGRTNKQMESIIANTALCIASYADALWKGREGKKREDGIGEEQKVGIGREETERVLSPRFTVLEPPLVIVLSMRPDLLFN